MDRFVLGVPSGRWQTNCYVVGDRARGGAVVIDPGEGTDAQLPDLLVRAGVTCEAILLTHGHIDHIWGVPDLARRFDVPVLLHPDDGWIWSEPGAGLGLPPQLVASELGLDGWEPPDERLRDLRDGERLSFAGIGFEVAHTPGHTPGHVTFLGRDLADVPVTFALGAAERAADGVLFSGDLLFAGTVGRSDLPGGDGDTLLRSLAATVLPMEDSTLVLPGHGGDTTIGRERAANPFLVQAAQLHV